MRHRSVSAWATMALLGAPNENVHAPPECAHISVGNVSLIVFPFTVIVCEKGVGSIVPSSAPPASSTDVRTDQTPSQLALGGAVLSPQASAATTQPINS